MRIYTLRGDLAVMTVIALLVLIPLAAAAATPKLDAVLADAYGTDAPAECRQYYQDLDLSDEDAATVEKSVKLLAEAGFPYPCPRDYLKTVAELSRAGIDLRDLSMKIQEAVAKQVAPERLVRVLQQRGAALKEARTVVLGLEDAGLGFLDRQMAYTVLADYLLRGVPAAELAEGIKRGDLDTYPAIGNVLR